MRALLDQYLFHWTPERAIWLGGNTLTWDARCAGIYAGVCITLLFHLLLLRNNSKLPSRSVLTAVAVLVLPMFVDVISIHFQMRQPINSLRHLTGLLFGISFCSVLYPAVRQLLGVSYPVAGLSIRLLLLLACIGVLTSSLTLWDRLFSYYLLESLSWGGFVGLATLIASGLVGSMARRC
ncbi:MAG: DUF2085 domain-containing protein [Geobacteraceae bacterium]|nr:DUF2085 domain-containing protein [Geobacteraceae bacterium]